MSEVQINISGIEVYIFLVIMLAISLIALVSLYKCRREKIRADRAENNCRAIKRVLNDTKSEIFVERLKNGSFEVGTNGHRA